MGVVLLVALMLIARGIEIAARRVPALIRLIKNASQAGITLELAFTAALLVLAIALIIVSCIMIIAVFKS